MCYSSLEVEAVSVGGSSWVIVQFKYVQLPGAATSACPSQYAWFLTAKVSIVWRCWWKFYRQDLGRNYILRTRRFVQCWIYLSKKCPRSMCERLHLRVFTFHLFPLQEPLSMVTTNQTWLGRCLVWHKAANLHISEGNPLFNVCPSCEVLYSRHQKLGPWDFTRSHSKVEGPILQ